MMELMEDEARNALRQVLLRTSVEHHRGFFGINGGYVDTNPSNYYIVYTCLYKIINTRFHQIGTTKYFVPIIPIKPPQI